MTTDLAKRAVACKGWRWMGGMQPDDDHISRVIAQDDLGVWALSSHGPMRANPADILPNLSGPATLGCLLALVREAWGDPGICASRGPGGDWYVESWSAHDRLMYAHSHPSEAAALVAALGAAP